MSDFWTPEKISRLFHLVAEGWSMSQIAKDIGCSRNAAIGKHMRMRDSMGIPRVRYPEKKEKLTHQQLEATVPKRVYTRRTTAPSLARDTGGFVMPLVSKPKPAPAPAKADTSRACGILDVTGCKYAIAEDRSIIGGHLLCNAKVDGEGSWCAHHHAVVHVNGQLPKAAVKRFRVPTSLIRAGAA